MSTGSPAWKVPSTPVTPAASSEARRSVTAATAPSSSTSVPRGSVRGARQSSRGGRRARARRGGRAPAGGVEQRADRLARQRVGDAVGGREDDGDAGAGGDP